MPVEDPDPVAYEPGRGVNGDLTRKVARETDVVVAYDHFQRESACEEVRGEVEQNRPKRRRYPDDRVLRIPRDHDPCGPRPAGQLGEIGGEPSDVRFGRSQRPLGSGSQTKVQVGDDDVARPVLLSRLEHERRRTGDRS